MQQGVTNRAYFISLFKQRLRDQYIQQWFTSVCTRSSCSIYKNITNHFRCQNYFHMVTNCKHRISLIGFRTKNHSLPNVIQGRGRNRRPYNKRLCPTCNVLGDELHCLFECENTRHIRHVLSTVCDLVTVHDEVIDFHKVNVQAIEWKIVHAQ